MSVIFNFQAMGQTDVVSAFKAVGRASDESTKAIIKDADKQVVQMKKLKDQIVKIRKEQYGEDEKVAKKNTDFVIKEYDRQVQAAQKAADQKVKAAERAAEQEAKSAEKAADRAMRASAKSARKAEEKGIFNQIKNGISQGIGLGGGFSIATGLLGAGGAALDFIGGAARQGLQLRSEARRAAISSRKAGQTVDDPEKLAKEAEATAAAVPGAKALDILRGGQAFTALTGQKSDQTMQRTMAEVSVATGTSIENVAKAMAGLQMQFKISDPKEFKEALAKLTFQGKEGAVELSEFAGGVQKIGAAAGRFGFQKGLGGVSEVGGILQVAREATGSTDEAITSVENMLGHMTQNAKQFKAAGVNVFDAKGQTNNFKDIMISSLQKVGGNDMSKKTMGFQTLLGEQGIRAFTPYLNLYKETFQAAKTDKKTDLQAKELATKAVSDKYENAINAPGGATELAKDLATAQEDPMLKADNILEQIRAAIADQLVPIVQAIANKFGVDKTPEQRISELTEQKAVVQGKIDTILDQQGFSTNPLANPEVAKLTEQKEAIDAAIIAQSDIKSSKEEYKKIIKENEKKYNAEGNLFTESDQWADQGFLEHFWNRTKSVGSLLAGEGDLGKSSEDVKSNIEKAQKADEELKRLQKEQVNAMKELTKALDDKKNTPLTQ